MSRAWLTPKQETEKMLNDLRRNARLALHMCEDETTRCGFSEDSWKQFTAVPAAEIAQRVGLTTVRHSQMPFISMSLIPSNTTVSAFGIMPASFNYNFGYLVDVTQKPEGRAHIMGASHSLMNSRYNKNSKVYWGHTSAEFSPRMQNHIRVLTGCNAIQFEHWLKAVTSSEHGVRTGNMLLDDLNDYYVNPPQGPQLTNEIIVAASADHVRAITVPMYNARKTDQPTYKAEIQLLAALTGLEHLAQEPPIDLPAVIYNMNSVTTDAAFTYLGKGQKELLDVARAALKDIARLRDEGHEMKDGTLHAYMCEKYGIDLRRPLENQLTQAVAFSKTASPLLMDFP